MSEFRRTIATPLPRVSERLIQRRSEEHDNSMEGAVVEYLFEAAEHGLSEAEVIRCAFAYAKGYSDAIASIEEGSDV